MKKRDPHMFAADCANGNILFVSFNPEQIMVWG